MPILRTLIFAGLISILSSLVFFCTVLPFFMLNEVSLSTSPPLTNMLFYWIGIVVLILGGAKWYFKRVEPTTEHGVLLGCSVIVLSSIISMLLGFGGRYIADSFNSWEAFGFGILGGVMGISMIPLLLTGWWKLCVTTILIILATTTYAGFEFDATYSQASSKGN